MSEEKTINKTKTIIKEKTERSSEEVGTIKITFKNKIIRTEMYNVNGEDVLNAVAGVIIEMKDMYDVSVPDLVEDLKKRIAKRLTQNFIKEIIDDLINDGNGSDNNNGNDDCGGAN